MPNLSDRIDNIISLLSSDLINRAEQAAILTTLAAYLQRIFNRGADSSETKIGTYSTKLMLSTKDQFIKKSAFKQSLEEQTRFNKTKLGQRKKIGSSGDLKKVVKVPVWIKFPNASKAVPVMIIEGGYAEFRRLNGAESGFVNLQFTGSLFESIIAADVSGHWVIGFNNLEKALIAQYLEKKYHKDIFKLSAEEIALCADTYYNYIREHVKKLFDSW